MNVISFNCNSIRSRLHQLASIISCYQPDIIGLQETKAQDDDFPQQAIAELGYQSVFYGQKTHYGVAILYRDIKLLKVDKGFPDDTDDSQRRYIAARFESPFGEQLNIINAYFPQGESRDHPQKYAKKQAFYAGILAQLQKYYQPSGQLIVMGDMNVAPEDRDIGIGEDSRKRWLRTGKCSFLPEERQWLQTLYDWGLEDTYRKLHPDSNDKFSWFDYRSRGFEREPKRGLRIDFVLATRTLLEKCADVGIDYGIRSMEKPSDHCPIWASFDGSS